MKMYKIIILVILVFLATLGGIFLLESINNNDSIANAFVVNDTNNTVYSNTTFKYIVTFSLNKDSDNNTIVSYYTRPSYNTSSNYYYNTTSYYNTTGNYYYTKQPYRTYTYTYYVYV